MHFLSRVHNDRKSISSYRRCQIEISKLYPDAIHWSPSSINWNNNSSRKLSSIKCNKFITQVSSIKFYSHAIQSYFVSFAVRKSELVFLICQVWEGSSPNERDDVFVKWNFEFVQCFGIIILYQSSWFQIKIKNTVYVYSKHHQKFKIRFCKKSTTSKIENSK